MKLNISNKQKNTLLFVLIFILAIYVRLLNWPYAISQINIDEAMTALNAQSIAQYGTDLYGTSFPIYLKAWGSMGQSVMLAYIMAILIKIFGFSFISIRLPMLIISLLSIFIFYKLVQEIFENENLALGAMFFVSICPWHILQSIWSIDCNMFPHFMLFSVYFLHHGIKYNNQPCCFCNKNFSIYFSMLLFGLTLYTYGISIFIVPIFLLITFIYLLFTKKISIKNTLICLIIFIIISLPILLMYLLNFFKINNNIYIGPITIQYFADNSRASDIIFFADNKMETLKENLNSLFTLFFKQYDNLEWNGTKFFGTTYLISLVFFFIDMVYFIVKKEKINLGVFMFFIWFIISLFVGIIIHETNINRLNIIWFPVLFFSLHGIYVTFQISNKWIKYIIISTYIILFISFIIYLNTIWFNKIDMSSCFSKKIIDAVEYADKLDKHIIYYVDGNDYIYYQFQNAIDKTESERVLDINEFENIINKNNVNDIYIIDINKLTDTKIDLEKYEYKQFGNIIVIE